MNGIERREIGGDERREICGDERKRIQHTFAPSIGGRRRLTRLSQSDHKQLEQHELQDKERRRSQSCSPQALISRNRKVKDSLAKSKEGWAAAIRRGLDQTDGSVKGFVRRTKVPIYSGAIYSGAIYSLVPTVLPCTVANSHL